MDDKELQRSIKELVKAIPTEPPEVVIRLLENLKKASPSEDSLRVWRLPISLCAC